MAEQQAGRVRVEPDVVFGTGGGRDLKCTVYHPPQVDQNIPAVLLVHGGSWINGDRSQLHGYGILLGRIGYVCVATEYRLAGESKWPAQIHDAKAALRWMRANAEKLGIDPNKISVEGNSAGAHLALMVAGTPNEPEFEGEGGNPGVPTHVAACVAIYAPTILQVPGQPLAPAIRFLFEKGAGAEDARKASPVEWANAGFPPTLLVTGNKDQIVPDVSSFEMYKRLIEAGVPTELHVYAEAPHAFDQAPDFGRQVAAIMALFLDRYVTNPRSFRSPRQRLRPQVPSTPMPLDWTLIEPGVIASRYPVTDQDVGTLANLGVRLLINLHEDAHDSRKLRRAGVRELHIPIRDFGAPQQEQIDLAVNAIEAKRNVGQGIAVHCAYGLGRTGTIIACWLVCRGMSAEDAIGQIRQLRRGSVEVPSQEHAVHEFEARLRGGAAVQSERENP